MLVQICRNGFRMCQFGRLSLLRTDGKVRGQIAMVNNRSVSQDKAADASATSAEEQSRLEEKHREILRGATKTMIQPSNFDKIVLTWSGRYATKEEIPEQLDLEVMNRARDKMRVMTSLWLLISTFIGCVVTVKIAQKKLHHYHTALDQKQKDMWAEQERLKKEHQELIAAKK